MALTCEVTVRLERDLPLCACPAPTGAASYITGHGLLTDWQVRHGRRPPLSAREVRQAAHPPGEEQGPGQGRWRGEEGLLLGGSAEDRESLKKK